MLSTVMQQIIAANRETKQATKDLPMTPEIVLTTRAGIDQGMSGLPVPEEVSYTQETINGISGEMYRYTKERPESFKDKIVLFIHGGGFMNGTVASRRYMCTTVLKYGKFDGFSMEYTQFPEGEHPEELVDAIRAFRGLQAMGYKAENIYLMGESAGAALCLMLALWLKDHKKALPGRICLISPPANLAEENPSRTERDERDPMIQSNINEQMGVFLSDYDKQSKYVSSVNADFSGFPKMLINVGTEEVLYDDCVQLAEKTAKDGVDVTLKVWKELFHVFMLIPAPESEAALDYCAKFFAE